MAVQRFDLGQLAVNLDRLILPRWRLLAVAVAACLGLVLGLGGGGTVVDQALRQAAWSLRQTPASGAVHIVEIDARSIAAIDRWPWPRRNYARLVDRLRAAGAASISFDVDFSSPSNPADDRAFAEALARADGRVALPTFVQEAGGGTAGWTEAQPIPMLRAHAAQASVSVLPDGDGQVRRMPAGVIVSGLPRPSLSAIVAGAAGSADQDFPIDFAIEPDTIPRHSFIDIRDGRFDPAAIRGRHVIVGATAAELGDRYAVPRHGVIPGVVIQALASETLLRGTPREAGWLLPLLVALAGGALVLRVRARSLSAGLWLGGPPVVLAAATVLDQLWHWTFAAAPALLAWLCLGAAAAVMRLLADRQHQRQHDAQTGMPNRLALEAALQVRRPGGLVCARIIDLDKIAAGLGGPATGTLLQRIRDRIATVTADATLYRIGDHSLAWWCAQEEALDQQVAALRTFLMAPFDVSGRRIDVTLGLGYAPGLVLASAAQQIENATLAAAQAVADGSNWHVWQASDSHALELELSLLGELDDAIAAGDLLVHYQPKLDLRSNRIVSVEALVRWQHPTRGFLPPDLFVPLAERNDRIAGLTLQVMATALTDLKDWHALGHRLTTAVNISAKLLHDRSFVAQLQAMIRGCGLPAACLALEITESAAMLDPEAAATALRTFRDMGVAISIDDYGTGHSTLSYLRQLPLSEIKLDRSFVQHAHVRPADAALVRSTVNLAHELGLQVVAEGVEDRECLSFLVAIGCDLAQGYLISRPVPAPVLLGLLVADRAAA